MSQLSLFAADPAPPTTHERDWHKYMARVFIEQARHFRRVQPGYAITLLEWAANRRRLAGE